MFQTTAAEQN